MNIESLHLLFGQKPTDEFVEDIIKLKSLNNKDVIDLIDKIIEWIPKEDIDKDFEEWETKLKKKEVKIKKRAIKILLFVMKELASSNVIEDEVIEDFRKLEIPIEYLNYMLEKISSSNEFTNKILGKQRPYESIINDIDWRIDKRIYRDNFEEIKAFIEISYSSKGKNEFIGFDLNLDTLRQFINVLKKVEDGICKME